MPAPELAYSLRPDYKRFVAVVGLDDEKRDDEHPSVIFQVYADAKLFRHVPL